MALDRASVLAYLKDHTQVEAATFFGCSERSIRRVVSAARSAVAARPVSTSPAPQFPNSPVRPARVFVPRAAADVAGPSAYWLDYSGSLVRVTPGTTGAAWNALQLPLVSSPAASVVAAPLLPVMCSELESGSSSMSGQCPFDVVAPGPVVQHNVVSAVVAPVKGYAFSAPVRADLVSTFFGTSVGPLPLPAVLLALLLIAICGVL